jgi:hypothetical protein
VNALGSVVGHELRRGVVRVQFNLVDCGDNLGAWIIEKLLKVSDSEVRDTNVADLAGGGQFLYLLPMVLVIITPFLIENPGSLPCFDEVPVRKMLRLVIRIGRAWPVHKIKIDVVDTKALE